MIAVIVSLIAIVFEVIAFMWAWPLQEGSPLKLLVFLGMHGIASVLIAIVLAIALPPALRRPASAVIMLLFCVSFFIPLLGLIGMIVGAFVSRFLPRLVPELPWSAWP